MLLTFSMRKSFIPLSDKSTSDLWVLLHQLPIPALIRSLN